MVSPGSFAFFRLWAHNRMSLLMAVFLELQRCIKQKILKQQLQWDVFTELLNFSIILALTSSLSPLSKWQLWPLNAQTSVPVILPILPLLPHTPVSNPSAGPSVPSPGPRQPHFFPGFLQEIINQFLYFHSGPPVVQYVADPSLSNPQGCCQFTGYLYKSCKKRCPLGWMKLYRCRVW